jgi:hypothetical protein
MGSLRVTLMMSSGLCDIRAVPPPPAHISRGQTAAAATEVRGLCRSAGDKARPSSSRSNGSDKTSKPPRLRTSAQSRSSACRETTSIDDWAVCASSSNSCQFPLSRTCASHTTILGSSRRIAVRASCTSAQETTDWDFRPALPAACGSQLRFSKQMQSPRASSNGHLATTCLGIIGAVSSKVEASAETGVEADSALRSRASDIQARYFSPLSP